MKKTKLVGIGNAAQQLGVSINTLRRWDKAGKLSAIRMSKGGNRYYKQIDLDFLLDKPIALAKNWVETKQPAEPQKKYYCSTRDVFQARLETLQSKLKKILSTNQAALLTAIVGEIGNNSYDHNLGNWQDVMGVFFAYSLAEKVIVLADRGQGILKTLKRVQPKLTSHKKALVTAFTKSLSSRQPENRGNGLKFVRQVVTSNQFSLKFQTGDAELLLTDKNDKINLNQISKEIHGCLAIINF